MGSTKRSKFTRARRAESSQPHLSNRRTTLDDALDRFSKALAIIETVAGALEAAQNDPGCRGVGAEVATLRQGVVALRAIHEEFDRAIAKVSP